MLTKDNSPPQGVIINILKKLPIFTGLVDDDYKLLLRICHTIELPRHKILFRANDKGHALFLLLNGRIEIKSNNLEHLGVINPGEMIGEMALVRDAPRSASAIALADSLLFQINQADLDMILEKSPRISYLIMKNIARELAERLVTSNIHQTNPHNVTASRKH